MWGLAWLGVLAAVLAGATYKLGLLAGLVALAGVLSVPLLLNNPQVAFAIWVTEFVIAESTGDWNVAIFAKLYQKTPAYFSINFLLLLLAAAATLLDVVRPHVAGRWPRPFGPALAMVSLAILFGYANGALGPGIQRSSVLVSIENYGVLLLPPLIVVNLIRSKRDLRRLLAFLAGLTVLKSVLGIGALLSGVTIQQGDLGRLTYYAPTANWMAMTYLLAVAAARLSRTRLPAWVWGSTPVVVASLVLSQRRSFWLATVFAFILLIPIASGATGRRLLLPVGLGTALAIYLAVATGVLGPVQGTLISRATSITPTRVTASKEDRYRLAELHNVLPALTRQPLEGLGVGVPWPERYPLPFQYPFNHYFTHFAVLYWWMTCGLLGMAAYLLLMGSAVVTGVRLWRRVREPLLRVAALALGLGVVGMMVVELTTTVIGNDPRGSALITISIGILAVIYRFSLEEPRAVALLSRTGDADLSSATGAKMPR